jgi:sterol desaturase/sphingolipid hydroxylase (fatty acid hydroxylase superfamily)
MSVASNEVTWRFAVFVIVFIVMATAERAWPRRRLGQSRTDRWTTNILIILIDSVVVRLMGILPAFVGAAAIPLVAVSAAYFAGVWQWGLFNSLALPLWLEILLSVIVLDFAIWFQHFVSHKVPLFWQLHRVHHADRDIDVTTALRFHPIEIALSMLFKVIVVLCLGASVIAVILFEIVLSSLAMFNHANVALPAWLDRVLRTTLVTPDMHRVHHSIEQAEHDTNFGFNLSIWDRLFSTYKAQPEAGHQGMIIGLKPYQHEGPGRLGWSLKLPFTRSRNGNS